MYWMLAREVLHLRGTINKLVGGFIIETQLIMPDLYFHREPQEQIVMEEEMVEQKLMASPHPVEHAPMDIPQVEQMDVDQVPVVLEQVSHRGQQGMSFILSSSC
jgi:hypothetical protein